MLLEGKKIGFALTGSFCTLAKIMPEIESLINEGAEVFPIISYAVKDFDTKFGKAEMWKKKLMDITGKEIISSIVDAEPIGPKSFLDIIIVAPCTGNTLSKIANAITDTPVTMAVKAHIRNQKPAVLAIATNDGLGANAKNIGTVLNMKNIFMVPYYQDDPINKVNSLVPKCDLILATVLAALEGKQVQPIVISNE